MSVKTNRINFDKATTQGNWGVEVTARKLPGRDSEAEVCLIALDATQKPRALLSLPVENLDELIQSLCVLQEQLGIKGTNECSLPGGPCDGHKAAKGVKRGKAKVPARKSSAKTVRRR